MIMCARVCLCICVCIDQETRQYVLESREKNQILREEGKRK